MRAWEHPLSEKFKRRGEILAYFGELRILKNFVTTGNSGIDSFAELKPSGMSHKVMLFQTRFH